MPQPAYPQSGTRRRLFCHTVLPPQQPLWGKEQIEVSNEVIWVIAQAPGAMCKGVFIARESGDPVTTWHRLCHSRSLQPL